MNTTLENTKKKNTKFQNSVSFKLALIIALSLLMLIPTIFIRNMINERQFRRDDTIREVTSKWGEEQQLCGPIILVPYEKTEYSASKRKVTYRHYFHILPEKLNINGELDPNIRYRGIYEVITYRSIVEIRGEFLPESLQDLPDQADKILWEEAKLIVGISDLTGLDAVSAFNWNDTSLQVEGGMPSQSSLSNGIHASLNIDPTITNTFKIKLALNGSETIEFVPSGKSSKVSLTSSWPDPSFIGAALPDDRKVGPNGFTAEWESLHLTRSFPQKWSDMDYKQEIPNSAFGVDLIVPVDIYQKSERSVKYALLFIGLTFLVIFFIEMISKQKIHPVQYLLTGAALIVFYSLLLALSEHLNFVLAYAISSASIIILIVSYASSIFSNRRYVITTCIVLICLYTFLYTILQMSDLALLFGNIGLFIVIALVMFFSRKIEWYNARNS